MGYYDDIAEGYHELYHEEQLKKLNKIKSMLAKYCISINPSTTLLDVGCGIGISTDFWGCDATGIDPAVKLIDINKDSKSKFVQASAEKIPFPDKSFDIVTSITAIHNFDDVEKGLEEIARVGKDFFIFSVLKKSEKLEMIKDLIRKYFKVIGEEQEDKDLIFFAKHKL